MVAVAGDTVEIHWKYANQPEQEKIKTKNERNLIIKQF